MSLSPSCSMTVAFDFKDRFYDQRKGITDEELLQAYFEYRQPIKVERIDYSRSDNTSLVNLFGTIHAKSVAITESHTGRDSALAALKHALEAR